MKMNGLICKTLCVETGPSLNLSKYLEASGMFQSALMLTGDRPDLGQCDRESALLKTSSPEADSPIFWYKPYLTHCIDSL